MKKINILTLLLIALPALLLQSCLKDQEDVFDEPASNRLQSAVLNAKKVLMSSQNGWVMDYYAGADQQYGGYAYTLKFDTTKVDVSCELVSDTVVESSYYKVTNDEGPVLTFDTYNKLMHFFATPSSSNYEAYHGDFEFVIDEVTDNLITMHGKRNGNKIYLHRLSSTSTEYLAKVNDLTSNFIISSLSGKIDTTNVVGAFDLDNHQLEVAYRDTADEDVTIAYVYTDTGIRLYKPLEIGGKKLSNFTYDTTTRMLTCTDAGATNVSLNGIVPAGYLDYDKFAGSYILYCGLYNPETKKYHNDSINVTLTPSGDGSTYKLSGLSSKFDAVMTYSKSTGRFSQTSQMVGTAANGNQVWMCAWSRASGGSLTWASEAGMEIVWNGDYDNMAFTWQSNGYSDLTTDSFILWTLTSSGGSAGALTDTSWGYNNSTRYAYLTKLVKIK